MNLNALKSTSKWLVLICTILAATSCKKEVEPPELPTPPTKWEVISGNYKIYDTTGIFLYDMQLAHKIGYNQWGLEEDSLIFSNFDGEFNFTTQQFTPNPLNAPNHVRIGGHDTLYDSQSKRWKLSGAMYENYNSFENDTIFLRFSKTNINYYLSDLTPYHACDCKQIAVKQQ